MTDQISGINPATYEYFSQLISRLEDGENRLEIKKGTLMSLLDDPDYIMILKIHATIETTINELIVLGMTEPNGGLGGVANSEKFGALAKLLTDKMQFGGRTGKIKIALKLKMISAADKNFIEQVSTFRNRYAHNIKNAQRKLIELYNDAFENNKSLPDNLGFDGILKHVQLNNDILRFQLVFRFAQFLEHVKTMHVPRGLGFVIGLDVEKKTKTIEEK